MNNINNELPSVYLIKRGNIVSAYNQYSDLICWWWAGCVIPTQDKIIIIHGNGFRPIWVDSVEQIKSAVDYQNKRG